MLLSVYIIIALYSCIFAMRRLMRPGVSKEIRYAFLIHHFLYVVTFIFIWSIFWANAYYYLFNTVEDTDPSTSKKLTVMDLMSTIASFSTGIILTFIRISEPYFRFLIKK
jgi:hypothetical protein